MRYRRHCLNDFMASVKLDSVLLTSTTYLQVCLSAVFGAEHHSHSKVDLRGRITQLFHLAKNDPDCCHAIYRLPDRCPFNFAFSRLHEWYSDPPLKKTRYNANMSVVFFISHFSHRFFFFSGTSHRV